MDVFEKQVDETIQKIKNLFTDDSDDYRLFFDKVRQDIEHFKTTGSFNSTKNDGEELTSNNQTQALRTSSKLSSRNTKMSANVAIKMERISESLSDHSDNLSDNVFASRAIKKENEMPPPQLPVKRTKRTNLISETAHIRSTRSKAIKKEIISEVEDKINHKISQLSKNPLIQDPHNRDSDIVLQKENISILTLTDTDEEDLHENINSKAKRTGSKTKELVKNKKLSKRAQMQNEDPCGKLEDEGGESWSSTNSPSSQEKKTKRLRSPSTEDDKRKQRAKQAKKGNRKKNILAAPQQEISLYENCPLNLENENCEQFVQGNDGTFVIVPSSKQNGADSNSTIIGHKGFNTTDVISKPIMNCINVILGKQVLADGTSPTRNLNFDDLMTDDESIKENRSPPKFQFKTKVKAVKPVFSPFENSPVKKRVEAFEKLGANIVDYDTVRITRTKTKAKAQQAKEAEEQKEQENETQLKGTAKLTPVIANRVLPFSAATSTSKIPSRMKLLNNESSISIKSASALKASQQEFRERELKRKEKVEEAKHKKEALLQAQIEEKRRRREEKQLKAQQVRETNDRNKEKILELQKLKDEKHKQLLMEKQEKLQKQREESEKKRLQAMKKAVAEKRKEEEKKKALEEDKLAAKLGYEKKAANDVDKKLPIYMTMKAPLLPTDECYDSDDSEIPNVNVRRPNWDRSENKNKVLLVMQFAGEKIKNTFFCRESKTPDLRDIFENIDPIKLKRTSSAIWRKPPRFTILPISTSFNENEEED